MRRLIALDMLRGFAMVCIMLDHMPIGTLRGYTLANWAIFDAAELFVLLSGFLVGLVWLAAETRQGTAAARRRFARRAFEVWRALILGGVALALLSRGLFAAGLNHTAVWNAYADWVISNPLGYVGVLATMWLQPNLLDVLAVYVLFLASVPITLPLMRRWPRNFTLGSVLVWLVAPQLNALIPNHRDGGLLFNPFGWQMLFFSGVAMGLWRDRIMATLRPWSALLTPAAIGMWIFGATIVIAARYGDAALPLRDALKLVYGEIDKWPLDGTRFLGIMAGAWLVAAPLARPLEAMATTAPGRGLQTIGKAGLWAFVIGVLLSVIGDAFQMNPPDQSALRKAVVDLWAIAALWLASALWMEHGAPRQLAYRAARLRRAATS